MIYVASLLLGAHQFVATNLEEGFLVALEVSDGVVVAVEMLDHDVALLVDFVVAVQLHILQNAVAFDHQGRSSHDLQLLHFRVQFLGKDSSTVRQVAKAGEKETMGNRGSSAPPASSGLHYSMSAPAIRSKCLLFM